MKKPKRKTVWQTIRVTEDLGKIIPIKIEDDPHDHLIDALKYGLMWLKNPNFKKEHKKRIAKKGKWVRHK